MANASICYIVDDVGVGGVWVEEGDFSYCCQSVRSVFK